MTSAVSFSHVSKTFESRNGRFKALDDVTFEVPSGSFFGVIGSSGAGKSTLIRTVNGLETPTGGTVTALGQNPADLNRHDLAALRHEIGMIFQHYNLLESKTIAQNVAIPLILAKVAKSDIEDRVARVLDLVGLKDRADHYPAQLSGGQCQRVAIARALVTNPKILLSDEATSALDPITTRQILDLLGNISEEYGITVLLITHQMSVIARACEDVVVMAHGHIIEQGKVSDVFSNPQSDLTKGFVETVVPRKLPDSLLQNIRSGNESSVVRVFYKNDAAKYLIRDIQTVTGSENVALLHAGENRLREVTLGQLVLGLDDGDPNMLPAQLRKLEHEGLRFEVLHV